MMTVEQMQESVCCNCLSAFTKYQTSKAQYSDYIFCFVEGVSDGDYYMNIFRQSLGDQFRIIPCESKKNVLEMYDIIYKKDMDSHKLAFFCDRDYDEPLNYEGVYETPCYAIENLYTNRNAFERYLFWGLKQEKDSENYINALKKYDKCFESFHLAIGDFNFFASAKNKYDKLGKLKSIEKFSKTIDGLVQTDFDGECKQLYSISSLNSILKSNPKIPNYLVETEKNRLNQQDKFYWYRGKYELCFYLKFLEYLKNDANGKKTLLKNCKIRDNYQKESFLRDYCQYADVDERLKRFLAKYVIEC